MSILSPRGGEREPIVIADMVEELPLVARATGVTVRCAIELHTFAPVDCRTLPDYLNGGDVVRSWR